MPPVHPRKSSSTSEEVAAYFYELQQLLTHVDGATTHYQVLGLSRSATAEDIKMAYVSLMRLQPQSHRTALVVPDLAPRIDVAFRRIAEAFAALSHFGKRIEYDNSLRKKSAGPLPPPELSWTEARNAAEVVLADTPPPEPPPPPAPVEELPKPIPREIPVLVNQASGDNRRRSPRLETSIPVQLTGYDRTGGQWTEAAHTIDASRLGIACRIRTPVAPGTVLHLLLPLPIPLRSHGCAQQGFTVYAIVRRVAAATDGVRTVGLEFLGEHPPAGYAAQPWATYGTFWTDSNRRREKRLDRFEMLEISFPDLTYLEGGTQPIGTAIGYTDNVSRSGACISVETIASELNLVKVRGVTVSFASRAFVRNRLPGGDSRERLCIQFVDTPFPV
jgi:hypothetical protein